MSSGEAPLSGVASLPSLSSSSWASRMARSVRVRKNMAGGGKSGLGKSGLYETGARGEAGAPRGLLEPADAIRGIEAASTAAPRSVASRDPARPTVLFVDEP